MVGPILVQAWLFLYMWFYMGLFHPRFQNDILFQTSSCASCCTCRSKFWILCYTWYLCPWGMEKRKRNLRRFYKWHLGRAGQIFCFYFKSHFTFKVIIPPILINKIKFSSSYRWNSCMKLYVETKWKWKTLLYHKLWGKSIVKCIYAKYQLIQSAKTNNSSITVQVIPWKSRSQRAYLRFMNTWMFFTFYSVLQ